MPKPINDHHFKLLTHQITSIIAGYNLDPKADWTETQKGQVENLVKLEKIFRKLLINDSRGHLVYKAFIKFITEDKHNILAARPYFRERQGVFSNKISPAIKSRKYKRLYGFNINYTFILFALSVINWGPNSKITKAARLVEKARRTLIELNTPLAISRARIFRDKTPEAHLTYMDLVQIAFEALCNAVDKYVLPYSPVFRSVIIGRIVGDSISAYSETMLHFYPQDRRKIYRANKVIHQYQNDVDYGKLAKQVNSGVELENPTNPAEIQQLMTAASCLSTDSTPPDTQDAEEGETILDIYPTEEENHPDNAFEVSELQGMLYNAFEDLQPIEQKYLQLKGCFVNKE